MKMMKKKMEMMEKTIDSLLSKKGFDVQKNEVVVQPCRHVEAPIPQPNLTTTQFCHYSKIAPSPPTIESQHKAIYKLATHRPTNPSLTKKIHQSHLL
jgi:ribosomal protein RSM22 (predicted rRNA methylase)